MAECVRGDKLYWRGRKQAVHSQWLRPYYRANVGPLDDYQHVHHTCGNPWCIEHTHLSAVTPKEHREAHRYSGLAQGFNETAL